MASRADPYGRNVAPTRNTSGLPQVSAEAFGAGVGEAMQGVAAMQMKENVTVRRLEAEKAYDLENIETMARWAKYQEDYGLWRNDARANAPLGAAGHAEAARKKLMEEDRQAFLDGIKNDHIRKTYEAKYDGWAGSRVVEEDLFERVKSSEYAGQQLQTATEIMTNVAKTATPEQFAEMRDEWLDAERPANVDEATWAQWKRDGMQSITYSFLSGRPPEQVKAALASGMFNDVLDPVQIDRLETNADTELKRMEFEAQARAREEKAEVKQRVDNIMRRMEDGFPVSDEEMAFLQDVIPKYGFDKEGYDVAVLQMKQSAAGKYTNATPAQMQNSLNELEALGTKATPQQIVERDYLRAELPRRQSAFASDPLSAGSTMGVSIGPVDWGNRQSVRSREEAAIAVSKKTGLPPTFLTDEEAKAMRPQLETPLGRMQVSTALNQMSPANAYLAAKQIAPNDPTFAASLVLSPTVRERVYEGNSAGAKAQMKVPQDKAQAVWRRTGGVALKAVPQEKRGEIYAMAVAIYRSHAIDRGEEEFNEGLFENSIEAAMGAYGTSGTGGVQGGLGTWYGTSFALPPGMTESRFGTVVGSVRQIQNPEYFPITATSKKRMNWDYLFKNYYPVLQTDGSYAWQRKGTNEFVLANDGKPYKMWVTIRDETLRKRGK